MIAIAGTGSYTPARCIGLDEIAACHGKGAARAARRSGVLMRRYVDGETQIDMGQAAARAALDDAGMGAEDIDLVISASGVPFQTIPATAPLYLRAIGIPDGAAEGLDINTTCLSFLSAFDIAATGIAAGRYRNVLIVSSEVASRALPWHDDPETAALFADAAAAVVLTPGATRVAASCFRTWHSGWEACQIGAGGTRFDYHRDRDGFDAHSFFRMNGRELFRLAAENFGAFVDALLDRAGWSVADVDRVVPHQASPLGLRHATRICGFPAGRVADICADHGNMIAASIPFVLAGERAAGRIEPGARVVMVGTSAGVTFGGVALEIA